VIPRPFKATPLETEQRDVGDNGARSIRVRYSGTCVGCGSRVEAGTRAWWDATGRHITCETCWGKSRQTAARVFVPGASAQRTADRLATKEHAEWNDAGLLKKASIVWRDEPSKARPWSRGAEGERLVGSLLNQLQNEGVLLAFHDLHVPRTSANVDHVAIAPSGIHVIDAKCYRNKQVEVVDRGGFFRRDLQLRVAKRNRTNLVDKLAKQILLIDSVTRDAELPTSVTPVLCFVHALWGVFKKEYVLNAVHVVPPPRLERLLRRPGPLGTDQVHKAADLLRARLRPA
jgi:hypothetical protein